MELSHTVAVFAWTLELTVYVGPKKVQRGRWKLTLKYPHQLGILPAPVYSLLSLKKKK
jgi:hypothetical protein